MTDLDIRSNYFLAQIFLGKYFTPDAVPPFLGPDGYELTRERLPRLRVETGSIVEVLDRLEPGSIRAFYLSNILEWLAPDGRSLVTHAVRQSAIAGALDRMAMSHSVTALPMMMHILDF